jgi:hypothetical protein
MPIRNNSRSLLNAESALPTDDAQADADAEAGGKPVFREHDDVAMMFEQLETAHIGGVDAASAEALDKIMQCELDRDLLLVLLCVSVLSCLCYVCVVYFVFVLFVFRSYLDAVFAHLVLAVLPCTCHVIAVFRLSVVFSVVVAVSRLLPTCVLVLWRFLFCFSLLRQAVPHLQFMALRYAKSASTVSRPISCCAMRVECCKQTRTCCAASLVKQLVI